MAVARIFTRNPEAATSLSEELRRQGYTVEVVVQDQPPPRKDKDVEIDFEFLRHRESPTYSDELITEFAPDTVALAQAGKPPTLPPAPPQMIDVPIEAPEVYALEGHTHDALPQSPVVMPAMPPVAIVDEPEHVAILEEPEHVYLLEVEQIDAEHTGVEQMGVEQIKDQPLLPGHQTGYAAGPKLTLLALLAAIQNLAHRVTQACREQINLRMEGVRAARRQRQLELEARQARAQERAAELQAAREAAAERLQQLLRERGDEAATPVMVHSKEVDIESVLREIVDEPVLQREIVDEPVRQPEPVVRAPIAAFQPPAWRQLLRKPEYVFAGVAGLGALAVAGLALMSFRPAPRLNARLDTSSDAATVQSNTTPVNSNAAKTARPSPAVRKRTTANPIVAVNRITTRHLGEDVIIRQYPPANLTSDFATQAKPAAHNRAQPELRHISDLEN